MKEDQFHKEMLKRLDVVISLYLDMPPPDRQASIASKASRLISLGLSPREVANILGKPVNYVTAILATKKARAKKGKANG